MDSPRLTKKKTVLEQYQVSYPRIHTLISLAGVGPPPPSRASPRPPPLRSAFGPAWWWCPPGSQRASADTPAPLH